MKKMITLMLLLASSNAFSAEIYSVVCKTAKNESMVEATVDIETGEQNKFVDYALGKPSPSILTHFEADPDVLDPSVVLELYTSASDGSPVAKLSVSSKGIGTLLVTHGGQELTVADLVCEIGNAE